MKIAVISAITGAKDTLKEIEKEPNVDYVCFMDKAIKSNTWQTIKIESDEIDPTRRAKPYKVTPEKYVDCDYSIWIDGNIILKMAPSSLIETFLDGYDLAVFDHGVRDCIYDEAMACIGLGLDDTKKITDQMVRYEKEGYPEHNGLSYCGVILRRHTPEVSKFNQMWWEEIQKGSRRDQLSFPYVVWKSGLKVARIQGVNPHENNTFYDRVPHSY